MKLIADCYSRIVGQTKLVAQRILAHSAFAMGNDEPYSLLVTGAAGLGKTEILRAEKLARAKAVEIREGREGATVPYYRSPSEFRLAGDAYFALIESVQNDDGIIIDELHEIDHSPTVQTRKVKAILKGLLDNGAGKIRSVKLDDDTVITRPASEIFFAVGTNFPEKIKDGAAIISRFGGETPLALYSPDELQEILSRMSESAGIRVGETSLGLLAKCGRGTARPLERIIAHLSRIASIAGKSTVNRAEALEAMQSLELYPLGVSRREISILVRANGAGIAVRMLPVLFAIEPKAVNGSISFLASLGLVSVKAGIVTLSPRGAEFLNQLRAERFHVAA